MAATSASPILLAIRDDGRASQIVAALNDFHVTPTSPSSLAADLTACAAVVFDGRDVETLEQCRRIGFRPIDDRPMILYLAPDATLTSRLTAYECGADVVLPATATEDEIRAVVAVIARWQEARSQWLSRSSESQLITRQLQQAYQQIELDLKLARQLQQSFLPRSLPSVGSARFAVSYRPCGHVGGDFYDVFRLDEHHVGFYVADAMGHGLPASLLTVFLKNAVHPKEVSGNTYRLVPPGDVLTRLNRDLIAQGLPELPFITMVYGLINCRDGGLRFARAAHPHPVYLPCDGDPELWQTPGTLLGVFEAEYPVMSRTLRPGDKFVVYTDGLPQAGAPHQPDALFAAAVEHRNLPVEPFVDRLSQQLLAAERQPDDFTLLGLEFLSA